MKHIITTVKNIPNCPKCGKEMNCVGRFDITKPHQGEFGAYVHRWECECGYKSPEDPGRPNIETVTEEVVDE